MAKKAKAILNGHLSVIGSKNLSPAVKAKVLEAPEGQQRAFSSTLYDAEGNPVVLQGKVRLSNDGGLTASVTVQNLDVTSFLRDVNAKKEATAMTDRDKEALADSLS